jgi:hypothetical protein
MTTQAVTPDANANPFDTPLPSEVNEHQQAVAASPTGNPFDEPLPSEKAEKQAANSDYIKTVNTGPLSPAGQAEKAMGAGLTNAEQTHQALKSTGQAALETAGGVVGAGVAGMSLDAAAPLVTTLAEHLPTLDKAYKILTALGAGTYTVQHLKDVMKIIGGK